MKQDTRVSAAEVVYTALRAQGIDSRLMAVDVVRALEGAGFELFEAPPAPKERP